MLANGRTTSFTSNQTTHSPSQKSIYSPQSYTDSNSSIGVTEQRQENGMNSYKTNDQDRQDDVKKRMSSTNNNNKNFWGSEMTSVNNPSQSSTNSNGFSMPMIGNSKTVLDSTTSSRQQPSSSSSLNNQASSNLLDNMNSNSNILSGRDQSISSPSSAASQYNSAYNSRQDILMQGLPLSRTTGHDINPMMHVGPNGTNEQYGSSQQRSYMSGPDESQIRGRNRQTRSPYPLNYFPQESHNNQTVSRTDKLQTEDRSLSEHFQWPQASFPASSIASNPSLGGQNRNHSSMQVRKLTRQIIF